MQASALIHPTSDVDGSISNDPTTSANGEGTHSSSSNGLVSASDASAVKRYKTLVYVVLSIAVIIVGAITYTLTANDETATFEREVRVSVLFCLVHQSFSLQLSHRSALSFYPIPTKSPLILRPTRRTSFRSYMLSPRRSRHRPSPIMIRGPTSRSATLTCAPERPKRSPE
jgi:hypothetical protein